MVVPIQRPAQTVTLPKLSTSEGQVREIVATAPPLPSRPVQIALPQASEVCSTTSFETGCPGPSLLSPNATVPQSAP